MHETLSEKIAVAALFVACVVLLIWVPI